MSSIRIIGAGLIAGGLATGGAAQAAHFKVLYSFTNGADGSNPAATLVKVGGLLYGTTVYGGNSGCFADKGCGTVFSITPAGVENTLYMFKGGEADGGNPTSKLLTVKGSFFGTTYGGGPNDSGSVYSLTTEGVEKPIYFFKGLNNGVGYDGAYPSASPIDIDDTLYGVTAGGGCIDSYCYGTVYKVTMAGAEKVVYRFKGGAFYGDGASPDGELFKRGRNLYGATGEGGKKSGGTFFSAKLKGGGKFGKDTVLHDFGKGRDGAAAGAGLVEIDGLYYGITVGGGTYGLGTVYSITPAGVETVIYSFTGGADGGGPGAPLVNIKGTLYGTTCCAYSDTRGDSDGTVFSVTPAGVETVLHNFVKKDGGLDPEAGLVEMGGKLYGTTQNGGTGGGKYGYGTVFEISP